MSAVTPESTLRAGFTWALWRLLDHLAAHFLPGSILDLSGGATAARASATGSVNVPAAAPDNRPGLSSVMNAALAALHEIDPVELEAALASLNDDNSPLVQCLAWALGAQDIEPAERQRRLEASLALLSKAEAFALLAVLLHQAQAVPGD